MKLKWIVTGILIVIFGTWWVVNAPPEDIKIGNAMVFNSVPEAIASVTSQKDFIAGNYQNAAPSLPPYDEVILNADESLAYVTANDGWFWQVDLVKGNAARFVDAPLMAAGAHLAPDNDNLIYFCSSYFFGDEYPPSERVGLYQLSIDTKAIKPLVLDVPQSPKTGGEPVIYHNEDAPHLKNDDANGENSRPVAFCNDLDVSADGKRIYFTEPFAYGRPTMGGGGTYREAVSLGQNGRVWRYDIEKNETTLMAQNLTFPDGILVEDTGEKPEESILITETIRFRIIRIFSGGAKAGSQEVVQRDLPGMPDGMDRYSTGNIWVGILKQRSSTIDWIHNNPWIKPFLLRLPSWLMPVSKKTSVLGLSADGRKPLFYSEHDGSVLSDIAVVIPGRKSLYLATIGSGSKGIYHIPFPEGLEPRK